ncbi:aminotransferase class I/II-fold pyridoxal phosphate-dependent enzyme [Lactobacillus sp. DCY120]|uniref:Aminotransferase n=1 Tax=Bombilactobacillus apium TaxID=2675299 RepID=A0A850QY36_9LACO|nr:aminotransferase class I/II-fold pyridoxal phosphate-dependent enzyme [Bombilactobacillus apium]NVY95619.1 aminotransferase class I/II-fold pyridoxal phosphate-dependent enzyme [Bombilactobacillus apium]
MPQLAAELTTVVNQLLDQVQPSAIRAFDDRISKIPGIIKLTIGEPDLDTPEHVKQAGIQSIANNESHYSAQKGTPELRQAISNYLKDTQNVTYDPETEVIVTVGATEALTAAMFTLLNPGDEVIIPTPAFALYFPIVTLTGAHPIMVDTSASDFVLTPELLTKTLEEHPHARAVLLNYPSNPTGREYSKDELSSLATIIADQGLYVIADEIYSELLYEGQHFSIACLLPERTILVSGLSKSHAMTGYRIGYLAAPAAVVANIAKMHGFLVTAPVTPCQAAAAEALNNGRQDAKAAVKIYQKRRDNLVQSLEKLGFQTVAPQGAFYLFAKIPAAFNQDDVAFALQLAEEAKVGCTPGSGFGTGGEGYLRFSYAASDADIAAVSERLTNFVKQHTRREF